MHGISGVAMQARRLPAKRARGRGLPEAGGPGAAVHGRGGGSADWGHAPPENLAKEGIK